MRSLRRQLTVGMLGTFALLLGAGAFWVYWATRTSLTRQFDAALRVKALVVTGNTQPKGDSIRVYFSDRFLQEFGDQVATDFFQVFDSAGRTVARSDSLSEGDLPIRFGTLQSPAYWELKLPNGQPGRAIGIRVPVRSASGRDPVGGPQEATIVVASDRSELDATMTRLSRVLAGSAIGLAVLTALVIPAFARKALRPLDELAERAARIDAHSLGDRFAEDAVPLELQPIVTRLNDLLARLESSFERERRFSSDLAHELRTPLAELRLQAEMALKWPSERPATADQATLEIVLQMEALVARLLELSRAEQGALKPDTKAFELGPFLETLAASFATEASSRRLEVVRHFATGVMIETDPVLFRSLVSNLVGNAVHYAPEGGQVELGLSADPGGFRLTVCNAAPHLTEADLPRMFERFWRKDAARGGEGGHSGLGLSLSRSVGALIGVSIDPALRDGVLVMTVRGACVAPLSKG